MTTKKHSIAESMAVTVPEGRQGRWAVERFEIEDDLRLWRIIRDGRDFSMKVGDIYTRLIRADLGNADPMMSDTPAERRDHIYPVIEMRDRGGRVLINGLGLGMVLQAALALPNVEHVDVIEIDQDVIDLVAPHYASDRVTVYHADAFTISWPKEDRWSVAWHDIWPTICTDNLPEMGQLHRKYGRRIDWQGSWQREYLQYAKRRDARNGW